MIWPRKAHPNTLLVLANKIKIKSNYIYSGFELGGIPPPETNAQVPQNRKTHSLPTETPPQHDPV
jgi:hypothetical protein